MNAKEPVTIALSLEQQKEKAFLEKKDKQLKAILKEWDLPHYTSNWEQKALSEAKKYVDALPSARELMKKKELIGKNP